MGWFDQEFVPAFLDSKAKSSQTKMKGYVDKGEVKKLPVLGKAGNFNEKLALIKEVASTVIVSFRYAADPWYFDHYTHHEVAWYYQEKAWEWIRAKEAKLGRKLTPIEVRTNFADFFKRHGLSMDCDDYAHIANEMLIAAGYPIKDTQMKALIVPFWSQLSPQIRWNHVICKIKLGNGHWATIDTNGLRWYKATEKTIDESIMKGFEEIYRDVDDYKHLIDCKRPF